MKLTITVNGTTVELVIDDEDVTDVEETEIPFGFSVVSETQISAE